MMPDPEQLDLFTYPPTADGQEHAPNPPGAYDPRLNQTHEEAARVVAEHPYEVKRSRQRFLYTDVKV